MNANAHRWGANQADHKQILASRRESRKIKSNKLCMVASDLSSLREWLWVNPPSKRNQSLRIARLQSLQQAADALSAEEYRSYQECWTVAPRRADRYERAAALSYLRATIKHTIGEI